MRRYLQGLQIAFIFHQHLLTVFCIKHADIRGLHFYEYNSSLPKWSYSGIIIAAEQIAQRPTASKDCQNLDRL